MQAQGEDQGTHGSMLYTDLCYLHIHHTWSLLAKDHTGCRQLIATVCNQLRLLSLPSMLFQCMNDHAGEQLKDAINGAKDAICLYDGSMLTKPAGDAQPFTMLPVRHSLLLLSTVPASASSQYTGLQHQHYTNYKCVCTLTLCSSSQTASSHFAMMHSRIVCILSSMHTTYDLA